MDNQEQPSDLAYRMMQDLWEEYAQRWEVCFNMYLQLAELDKQRGKLCGVKHTEETVTTGTCIQPDGDTHGIGVELLLPPVTAVRNQQVYLTDSDEMAKALTTKDLVYACIKTDERKK